ncbi:DUF7527 domain-containing protein [Halodesulfurarchaeum formicicum]|uniref:DUF7527 domain-containing protein n=1 Tax=Halodesulfurarchaeum formicicum TaxID=1873524 RepID=A0A1J1ACC4_9EURY|nr:hypothetical protein [Halodesulfurarchaeum formicicum]APE95802.1 hypothetical protein HSR6_1359 [Halodesulfurarchaeum formicicum]
MHSRTVDQVRSWDSRPFSGGMGGLSELSDHDHTGAVVAGDTWLFMLNGRVIGVFEGSLSAFEESGTVYAAPHDSLPLLFAMQERGGQPRARYFTEDTPLAEADRTLSEANFTGYVELSENVLSGDYYLVYYGGTRRAAAFIGESGRLETSEKAYELAADEVGLYEVMDVSMTITEIPEPATTATGAATDTATAAATDSPDDEPAVSAPDTESTESPPEEDQGSEEDSTSSESPAEAESSAAGSGSTADVSDSPPQGSSSPSETEPPADPEPEAGPSPSTGTPNAAATERETDPEPEEPSTETASDPRSESAVEADADSNLDRMFRAEAEWRRTRAIPALDPDETEPVDSEAEANTGGAATSQAADSENRQSERPTGQSGSVSRASSTGTTNRAATGSNTPQRKKLEAALEKRDERIEHLEERLESAESQRESLEAELEEARSERARLEEELADVRSERDELQARVEELEAGGAPPAAGGTGDIDPATALAGTNLFVRYESKGKPTLEAIAEADQDAINANLQLEHHTQFESESAQVDGQAYRPFLEGTGAFRFVSWLLREFPYELLDLEADSAMGELFEAIPQIDRVEFDGSVTVDPESGAQEEFAIVMRDRMGNPLAVAAYNEGRNPVQGEELETLLDGARAVGGAVDSLAGAFYVTASFFEPQALESAESAASSGGLFSRNEKASYVKPDGGSGFHLGLIEDRSETFHVTVPKL